MPHSTRLRSLVWCGLVLSLPAFGQRPSRSGVGLKAAGQWATQHAEGLTYQPIPGAAGGVYFPLWCGYRFELQPELLVSFQGASQQIPEGDAIQLRTLYVQLPLSAKLFLSNTFNAQFGVLGGRLLNAKVDGEDASDIYRPWDFGFTAGLGVDLSSGVDITARYYMGHTPVISGNDNGFPKNRVAQLSFGYRVARFSHARHRRTKGKG